MKKKTFLIFILFFSLHALGQDVIALQNGTKTEFYTDIDSAFANTDSYDTVYLPGIDYGNYNLVIDKPLIIYGVGINSDSLSAWQGIPEMNDIFIEDGASGTRINGIECDIVRFLNFGTSNPSSVNNIEFDYCDIFSMGFDYGNNPAVCSNIVIKRSLVGGLGGAGVTNLFVSNCIIGGGIGLEDSYSTVLSNCIFLKNSSPFYSSNGSTANKLKINNSIFLSGLSGSYLTNVPDGVFRNNIFEGPFVPNGYLGFDNMTNVLQDSIFVNQTGNTFNFSHDYHLKPTCVGVGAGTNGDNVGIYGGAFPWKESVVPNNPWIKKVIIAPVTNVNGDLPVDIEVEAQTN